MSSFDELKESHGVSFAICIAVNNNSELLTGLSLAAKDWNSAHAFAEGKDAKKKISDSMKIILESKAWIEIYTLRGASSTLREIAIEQLKILVKGREAWVAIYQSCSRNSKLRRVAYECIVLPPET